MNITDHLEHYKQFIERNHYEELTDEQKADCYIKAYPGRVVGLVAALLVFHGDKNQSVGTVDRSCGALPGIWADIAPQIQAWVERGLSPDDFLSAILTCDLQEAVAYASAEMVPHLYDVASTLYRWLPGGCWGGQEQMRRWETLPEIDRERIVCNARGYQQWISQRKS